LAQALLPERAARPARPHRGWGPSSRALGSAPMDSWFTTSSKEWTSQLRDTLNKAATSAQNLAERAELELKQQTDQLRASAQILAEHGEAAFRASADKVVERASELGFISGSGQTGCTEEELTRRFEAEARVLAAALASTPTPPTSGLQPAAGTVAEVVTVTLRRWEVRLGANSDSEPASSSDIAGAGLRAMLRSRVLDTTLSALAGSAAGRAILQAAAKAASHAGEQADDAEETSENTADEGKAAQNGESPDMGDLDDKAARLLWLLISRASLAPPALLARLLVLLADSAVADEVSREGLRGAPGSEASEQHGQEVQWVLDLLSAAFTDALEAALHGRSELSQSLVEALAVAGAAAGSPNGALSVGTDGAGAEGSWLRQLDMAEASGRSFRELRTICTELAAAQKPEAVTMAAEPLANTAGTLAERRVEGERRAEELVGITAECVTAKENFEAQLSASATGFEAERASLRQKQEEQRERTGKLIRQREELRAQLQAVEAELAQALAASSDLNQSEERISESEERVQTQLQQEISFGESENKRLTEQRRLLMEACSASRDVEALLATRAEELAALDAARGEELGGRRPEVAAACLEAERRRGRQVEELLVAWHAAVWGPGAEALASDPALLALTRGLHMRAGSLVEQAWRESVQLAAETLGDTNVSGAFTIGADPGAVSEEMSSAAERYKEMRQQLEANLDRLAKLEAAVPVSFNRKAWDDAHGGGGPGGTGAPTATPTTADGGI